MLRPTDGYGERRGGILERFLVRGTLLLVTVVLSVLVLSSGLKQSAAAPSSAR